MIQGEKVNLRPVTRADLELLKSWANEVDLHGEFNTFGLRSPEGFEKRFNENGYLGADSGMLLITTKEGEVIGDMSYYCIYYGPGEGNKVPMIGISIHKDHRGKGYGVEAQKLMAEYLFKVYPAQRVEASTDIENIPEQRALEKAGFSREGVLRRAQFRGGTYHDLVLYSKLRGE